MPEMDKMALTTGVFDTHWLSIFIGVHVAPSCFFGILDFGASVYNGHNINMIYSKLSMTTYNVYGIIREAISLRSF